MKRKKVYDTIGGFCTYLLMNGFYVNDGKTHNQVTLLEMDVLIRDFMQELENMKDNERRYKGV